MPTTYIPTTRVENAHTDDIWSVVWTAQTNTIVTGSADGTIRCWDGTSGESTLKMNTGNSLAIISLDASADGKHVASASMNGLKSITTWSVDSSEPDNTIESAVTDAWTAHFSPNGAYLATGSHTGHVNLYSVETGKKEHSFATKDKFILSVAFSPDGKYLAGGAEDGAIYVFDIEDITSGKLIHTLTAHAMAVRGLSFSSDGQTLVSASDDKCVHVYDVEHGQLSASMSGHSEAVLSVAVNPNLGKAQVASGGSDRRVKIWDLATRSVLETHEVHEDQVWGVAWNPEGTKLVSVSSDKSIQWFASSGSS